MTPATKRPRILFIAEAVTLAHPARALTLARTLDASRFEVHLAWDPRYNGILGDLGLPYHPISSLPTSTFLTRLASGAPMHDRHTLEGYVEEDRAVIDRIRPAVVVGDFRISLAASARLAGTPLVAVANAYWSPYGRQSFLFPEYEYPGSRLVGDAVAQRLFTALRPIGFAAHARPLNAVLRRHGLPSIGSDIRNMYTHGDRTAYADVPELVPIRGLPPAHRYIGAVLWSPPGPRPSWWETLPDRPLVYVTLGSSGEPDMLGVVLDALSDLDVSVMAATAARSRIATPPANVYLADFLPGTEAAARASLVICNGGSATTYQALTNGVPVLALASNNMDQHLNMTAVSKAVAGDVLRARGITAPAIRSAVQRLMADRRYRDGASAIAIAHRDWRPAELFPAVIEELLATR